MLGKYSRRSFLKNGALLGVGSLMGNQIALKPTDSPSTLAVAHGADPYKATVQAIQLFGGFEPYIKKNGRVAILANPQRPNPGAYTKPQVLQGVIEALKRTGAKEIACISWLPVNNWELTGLKAVLDKNGIELKISDLKREDLFQAVKVKKGIALKEARIIQSLFQYDHLINVPICKDHAGNRFTGTLKNLMGLNSPKNNRVNFHKPGWKSDPKDIQHLDQCIADLNTVIPDHLCVVDASEFIVTNGPFGPGKLHKADRIVVGTDRVAIDAYCCGLWGLKPEEIHTIRLAHRLGLGEIDLKKVKMNEKRV